jgi:transcriptional regulator GlxA family with amidase domain
LNRELIPWIVNQYKAGAEIVSFCTGAFLLASTGLLTGRKCATHWYHINDFRKMFPDVNLVDDKVMTAEHGIYTSGGAYSYLNLLLYIIEKYTSREIAIIASKIFAIEIDRKSQAPFIMFKGQKEHEDEPIKKAQEFIETNFQDKIVDQLINIAQPEKPGTKIQKATANNVNTFKGKNYSQNES